MLYAQIYHILFVIVYIIKYVVICVNMWMIRYTPAQSDILRGSSSSSRCVDFVCVYSINWRKCLGKKIVSAWGIKGPFLLLLSPQKYYTAIIYTAFTLYQGLWVMWTWFKVHTRKGRGYMQILHYLYETWASQIWGPRDTRCCRTKYKCSARDTCI